MVPKRRCLLAVVLFVALMPSDLAAQASSPCLAFEAADDAAVLAAPVQPTRTPAGHGERAELGDRAEATLDGTVAIRRLHDIVLRSIRHHGLEPVVAGRIVLQI